MSQSISKTGVRRPQVAYLGNAAVAPASSPETAPTRTAGQPKRHLTLIEGLGQQAQRAAERGKLRPSLVGFAVGVLAIVIIAAQLSLSILQTSDAYELSSLKTQQRDMARVERLLEQNVQSLSSPQNLAENAKALGMVQNVQPAYLRLSDGAVIGDTTAQTQEPLTNSVANATLGAIPLVNGETDGRQAGQASGQDPNAPVVWRGNLPAPVTH